jgi:hypothetical protein
MDRACASVTTLELLLPTVKIKGYTIDPDFIPYLLTITCVFPKTI